MPLANQVNQWDPEQILPMSMIREHTRTDDIGVLSDAMLAQYRATALDAAARHTGIEILQRNNAVEEFYWRDVFPPNSFGGLIPSRTSFTVTRAFADEIAYVSGSAVVNGSTTVRVTPGSHTLRLPVGTCFYPLMTSCNNAPVMTLVYAYGARSPSELHPAIITGCLKFIAHLIENPGDLVVTQSVSGGASSGNIGRAADPVYASGAIHVWNTIKENLF